MKDEIMMTEYRVRFGERDTVPILLSGVYYDPDRAARLASEFFSWEQDHEVRKATVTYVDRDCDRREILKVVLIQVRFNPTFEVV